MKMRIAVTLLALGPINNMRFLGLTLLAITGCAGGQFMRTDPGFAPTQRMSMPDVCLHKPASEPYRVVGVISVRLAAVTPASEFELRAIETALDVGCEVLAPHRVEQPNPSAWDGERPRLLFVHGEGHQSAGARNESSGGNAGMGGRPGKDSPLSDGAYLVREFDCGLYVAPGNG